jgi:aspartokinase
VGEDAVRKLGHTNYDVADQLSNLGMEAIHPKAAKTLRQAGIPLRVTNAFEPEDPGTLIDDQPAERTRSRSSPGSTSRAGGVRTGHGRREGLRSSTRSSTC